MTNYIKERAHLLFKFFIYLKYIQNEYYNIESSKKKKEENEIIIILNPLLAQNPISASATQNLSSLRRLSRENEYYYGGSSTASPLEGRPE